MSTADSNLIPRIIDGRISRKTSNGLKMAFAQAEGESLALAIQSLGDGKGAKVGMLFGFKNGGPGKHGLTYPDGRTIFIQSREQKPSLITDADGAEIATVNRVAKGAQDASVAVGPSGETIVRFTSDPVEPMTPEVFKALLTDAAGNDLGRLHVIRKSTGWKTLSDVLDSAWTTYVWWDQAGQSLPFLVLGTRLILLREPTPLERDVLLAACVDIAIGIRPYIAEMN